MKKIGVETAVGLFIVIGFASFAFLAIKLGHVDFFRSDRYRVTARFDSVSGLRLGAPVELAGVRVGAVDRIGVDPAKFEAVVDMLIEPQVKIPKDSIASIRTAGIIGDKFIKLSPGAETDNLGDSGEITDTESAISLEELVSKYIFEKK